MGEAVRGAVVSRAPRAARDGQEVLQRRVGPAGVRPVRPVGAGPGAVPGGGAGAHAGAAAGGGAAGGGGGRRGGRRRRRDAHFHRPAAARVAACSNSTQRVNVLCSHGARRGSTGARPHLTAERVSAERTL